MGIHPLEGHLQLGKDIVRGIKLTDTTFTPCVNLTSRQCIRDTIGHHI